MIVTVISIIAVIDQAQFQVAPTIVVKISESFGNLRRHAVNQTPVKNPQLKPV